jgi:CHAT domain-containing protein/tetratricopeptide (TPR) repeat protein
MTWGISRGFLRHLGFLSGAVLLLMPLMPAGLCYQVETKVPAQNSKEENLAAAQKSFDEAKKLKAEQKRESLQKAFEKYTEALKLYRAAGDKNGEASTLQNTGLVFISLGENRKAIDYFEQALVLYRALGNKTEEASTLNSFGDIFYHLGDVQKALNYLRQAAALLPDIDDKRIESSILNDLGVLYSFLGEKRKALDHYERALLLRRATGDKRNEAQSLGNIGILHKRLGDNQKALDYLNQALLLHRATGNKKGEAVTLHNMGAVYNVLGDTKKALDYFEQALPLERAIGNKNAEAHTLSQIGKNYELLGERQKATGYYEQTLALSREIGNRTVEIQVLYQMAYFERATGALDNAKARIEKVIELLELLRSSVTVQEQRTSFFATVQSHYELYTDVLMQLHELNPTAGYNEAALLASEKVRARSLLELLIEANAEISQGADPVLLERRKDLQNRINAKDTLLSQLKNAKGTEARIETIKKEIAVLISDYQQVQAEIKQKSPNYAALTQPQSLSLKEIQQLLDKETLLLEYALGEERSYLWLITLDSIFSYRLPKREEIDNQARRVYELLTAREPKPGETDQQYNRRMAEADAQYWKEASSLSQMVLGPVAGLLEKKRLVIVADSSLQYLPFSALPKPAKGENGTLLPLIADHEIVNLPSASVLAQIRQESAGRSVATKTVAVLADPVYSRDDPRVKQSLARASGKRETQSSGSESIGNLALLRSARELTGEDGKEAFDRLLFSGREAAAISSLVPLGKHKQAVGFEASRKTATSDELGRYRFIHFATHGILNSSHPELSGIVLSLIDETGRPQDGFLRLHDIYNLRIPADLVVLSACRTGLGKEIKGEGLVGLTRGFMYAGASRVAASLWKVDDSATAELMKQFYQGMLGKEQLSPSAALRAAQLSMLKKRNREAPYYWAAFLLQGDWKGVKD